MRNREKALKAIDKKHYSSSIIFEVIKGDCWNNEFQ